MKWTVAAPFFSPSRTRDRWLDDFVVSDRHSFRKVGPSGMQASWHKRNSRATPWTGWTAYLNQSRAALADADGVVTVFPQLAVTVAARSKLTRNRSPLVAWCFNIGEFPLGAKRTAAKFALSDVDRFVVHSSDEVRLLSDWLEIPPSRVEFVHLQRAPIPKTTAELVDAPFAISLGSANRDYATLLRAAKSSAIPLTVVASPRALDGLDVPSNVRIITGVSAEECHRLTQQARFSIVPLADVKAASGQVTVVDAMRVNRPVIATKSVGTQDYIDDGRTGLLVPPQDEDALRTAMLDLWESPERRADLAAEATRFAEEHLSDQAAAASLLRVLDDVSENRR